MRSPREAGVPASRVLVTGPLAALFLAAPAGSHAQVVPPDRSESELTVALVISGGASLGVYEAGYLYVLGEVLKRQGIPLRVATGASAGSGNALFSTLSTCGQPNARPDADPGYRFWLGTRFAEMFRPAASTPISVFTAQPGLDRFRRLVTDIWERGLPAACDVLVGIPVTRIAPLVVPLGPDARLTAPRQLLRFTVRIRGRGPGRPPVLENAVDPELRAPQLLLPLAPDPDAGWQANLERLLDVVAASSALPYAFPPVRLDYCVFTAAQGSEAPSCPQAEDTGLFIDGGVFDNRPLRLASALVPIATRPGERTLFIYLDPNQRAYPLPVAAADDTLAARMGDAFGFGAQIAAGFIGQAGTTELFTLLEERPAALDSVLIATSRYPPASGFLANFLGMFEREFRRFDFYLGMSDAFHDLESWDERVPSRRGRQQLEALWTTESWRPLRCLRLWTETAGADVDPECAGEELRDLRILAQIAVNRVYSSCRTLSEQRRNIPIQHIHCRRAVLDSLPPTIVGDPRARLEPAAALRQSGESELDYNLRLLAAYRFHFRDLGVPRERAGTARRVLARRLRAALRTLAKRQPEGWQAGLLSLSALGTVDQIAYEPPRHWGYVVVGTPQEVGVSYHPSVLPDWFRVNLAFRIDGLASLLTQDPNRFAAGLFGGPDIELRPLTSPAFMITLAGRVGYQLSSADRFRAESCTAERADGDARDCSQLLVQGVAALTAIERLRLQVTLDYFTRRADFDDRTYDVYFALGMQF